MVKSKRRSSLHARSCNRAKLPKPKKCCDKPTCFRRRATIRPALQSAVTMGCVRCQLEARLELGEIEIQAGNAERGRAQLHELANEAGRRGFRLIAEQADADSR